MKDNHCWQEVNTLFACRKSRIICWM